MSSKSETVPSNLSSVGKCLEDKVKTNPENSRDKGTYMQSVSLVHSQQKQSATQKGFRQSSILVTPINDVHLSTHELRETHSRDDMSWREWIEN